jgi:hypothetical protein
MKKIFIKLVPSNKYEGNEVTYTIYGEFYFMTHASTTRLPTVDDLRRALAERVREFVQRVRKFSERVSEGHRPYEDVGPQRMSRRTTEASVRPCCEVPEC